MFIQETLLCSPSGDHLNLLDPFLQIIQFFPEETRKECSQLVMEKFISNKKLTHLKDP